MNIRTESLTLANELANRFNTGAAVTMVERAMNAGAELQISTHESNGYIPIENPQPIDVYRALMTTNGVTIAGPTLNMEENGLGISLEMVLPGYSSVETTTHFDLNVGSTKITLPTDGSLMDAAKMRQLLATADVTHVYDDQVITGALHVAGSIGLAPPNVLSATEWFLQNQSYINTPQAVE